MAAGPPPSFERFSYLLRPSKQVERKIFVEALHRLGYSGFDIPSYTYLGFGSIFYADFILFRKYLYMKDMICVEREDIPCRMAFNKPFGDILLRMGVLSDVLPDIDHTKCYFVWADYEGPLDNDILADISTMVGFLREGSILVVTVEADRHLLLRRAGEEYDEDEQELRVIYRLKEELGRYSSKPVDSSVLGQSTLPEFFVSVMRNNIEEEAKRRKAMEFIQIFNFKYADGAQMVTMGGMLATPNVKSKLRASKISKFCYANQRRRPKSIAVPPLTLKESQWLEQNMTAGIGSVRKQFEIRKEYLDNFRKYMLQYPRYYETLL